MSMSSLGNQLAALSSSSSKSSGFHKSSGREQNDGIGRGFAHSTKHGYSVSTGGGDASKRPSVLYDSAREAAEVTLETLREDAIDALGSLSEASGASDLWKDNEFVGSKGLLSLHNLNNFERGTATHAQNVEVDKCIEKLMGMLMSTMGEQPPSTAKSGDAGGVGSNPILMAVLQVVEYLLRRYDLHSRPSTASLLIKTFLPLQVAHPTAYPQLFSRVLSLVDLQSVPEWTFLSPYAARNSPPLNRGMLAKRAARDDALISIVAGIGKKGMEVCVKEGELSRRNEMQIDGADESEDNDGDSGKALPVRTGISTLISFSASILAEALHIQSSSKDSGITGGVKESSVRVLFPLVCSACKCGGNGEDYCSEWKGWGRILTGTLVSLCPLSKEVKVALCDAVAEGLPVSAGGATKERSFEEALAEIASGGEHALSSSEADDACGGTMTLLSVLGTMSSNSDDDEDWENYLPMLPPKRGKRKKTVVDYLGCELPSSTYELLRDAGLPGALGAVLRSLGGESDDEDEETNEGSEVIMERMMPLLASILMHSFRRIEEEAGSSKKKKSKKDKKDDKFRADKDALLILGLINDPSLSSLWGSKNSALVAAVTVHAITSYDKLYKSGKVQGSPSAIVTERYSAVLKALSASNSAVYDQAVAYAVNTISNSDVKSDEDADERMSRLANLLGKGLPTSSRRKGKEPAKEMERPELSGLLPPRVALESADPKVRLDAISQIKSAMDCGDADEDLGRALLRRLLDDDAAVASAAGEIVAGELKKIAGGDESSAFGPLADDLGGLAKEAISLIVRWTFVGKEGASWSPEPASTPSKKKRKKGKKKGKDEEQVSPLPSCISVCGSVMRLITEQESLEDMDFDDDHDSDVSMFCALLSCLGAHLTNDDDSQGLASKASEAASAELLELFDGEGDEHDSVVDLLPMHPVCRRVLSYLFNGDEAQKKAPAGTRFIRDRFLWVALHSYSEKFTLPSAEEWSSLAAARNVALDLVLYQMKLYTKDSKKRNDFEQEAHCLSELCKNALRGTTVEELEKAILDLASTPSTVSFDEIVKPVLHTAPGLPVLLHACLLPLAGREGISRLLEVALEVFGHGAGMECIVPALALLSHQERSIRERVLALLWKLQSTSDDGVLKDMCSKATDKSSPIRSSLVMDGANALPSLLGQIVLTSPTEILIEGCKSCALKEDGTLSSGGCQASAVILDAMEKAGEGAFPLLKRWDYAGKDLFQTFLGHNGDNGVVSPSVARLRDCVLSMLKGVLVNEAQAGDDGQSLQISIGPSKSGRRTRSYSIGASSSFTTLEPYPESMLQAILEALSSSESPLLLARHMMQLVIVRQSWTNGVFPKLDSKSRNAIASALLRLRTQEDDELAGSALLGLPLKSSDIVHLLKGVDASQSEIDQAAVVLITDCVRGKLDVLGSAADISKLSSKLFVQLLSLSSVAKSKAGEGDSGGRDYTRVSILQTLLSIHSHYKSQLTNPPEKQTPSKLSSSKRRRSRSHSDVGTPKALASQADLLVGLVGGDASTIIPLNSARGRALSLSLLTCLCEESPSAVVTSLLPALMGLAGVSGADKPDKKVDTKALGDAMVAIVPAYCAHAASANLSLFSLLESFVGKIVVPGDNEKLRYVLLDHLVDSLKLLPTKESSSEAITSLTACVMALQAFNLQKPLVSDADSDTESEPRERLDERVLANTTSGVKIPVSLSLLQYAEKLMSCICGLSSLSAGEPSGSKTEVDISQVASLALRGSNGEESDIPIAYNKLNDGQQRSILYLAINLLQSVRDALSTPAARRMVRKSKGDDADLCLRLWNELMQTHTNTLRAQASAGDASPTEKKFWDAAPIATGECLQNLQNLLPVPHFLASVSSALTDDDVDNYIRKKAVRLLADRVSELSADSPEASLFLEMVPDLVAQVDVDRSMAVDAEDSLASTRRTIVMQQGALVAIESFVRSLYPSAENSKMAANAAAVFLPALASVTKLLDSTARSWIKANGKDANEAPPGIADAECQLLSSASLCISTLVKTLKARCLPQLPAIIKPLVSSLQSVNSMFEDANDQASSTGELLQLSILTTLQAIAETLPQFLLPYLPLVFSDSALPSKELRRKQGQGDHSVRAAALQVETALATKVQIRQLIPALSKSLSKNLQSEGSANWQEACSIINVMNIAIESSQRSELSPIIGKVFNGLVLAYGFEGDDGSRSQMLQTANKCLLSLVMKLSEAQLRPLYARLREWRGDIEDGREGTSTSVRRYAFWSLSAELSKSLRSIFLPCLTSVLTDLIDELEMAVSLLCQRSKKADGSKRRRVEDSGGAVEDMDKVKPLQPLLLCLESALKADAHEGGDWTRGDDKQRYNMILNHLGKLLLAHVPKDFPVQSDLLPKERASTSAFQQLVQGVGTLEHGNVAGCLTALAAAAGNEQLWKPLNFAVLEACGHKRSEVRKAGISCLLSIIETIGEEYMVLLPECLPVLSELLEDDDEIAGMAKECVRQGEELLGESLEDSLR